MTTNQGNLIRNLNSGPGGTAGDYWVEAAAGNIPGSEVGSITGRNLKVGDSVFETLWDQGGNYTRLTADTQLYISSSSASDTAVEVTILGVTDDFQRVVRTVTTNGQNQVPISGLLFAINAAA
ncbi:hypothetical protein, partial [Sulfurovum sp.]|uniref:hypothetical protein n=1 Tax=Sulfurovum sp. TaxID=1969726 RepID=UPI002867BFED